MNIKSVIIAFIALFMINSSLLAQGKYGHMNSGNLLEQMPEVKAADKSLITYQEGLVDKGEAMVKAFEQKYNTYVEAANSGTMSKKELSEKEIELQSEQQRIGAYEQEVIQMVQAKRQELLEPILKKIDEAIQAVGKENSYLYIFDTSALNAVLFAAETEDVSPLVKAKLGL